MGAWNLDGFQWLRVAGPAVHAGRWWAEAHPTFLITARGFTTGGDFYSIAGLARDGALLEIHRGDEAWRTQKMCSNMYSRRPRGEMAARSLICLRMMWSGRLSVPPTG